MEEDTRLIELRQEDIHNLKNIRQYFRNSMEFMDEDFLPENLTVHRIIKLYENNSKQMKFVNTYVMIIEEDLKSKMTRLPEDVAIACWYNLYPHYLNQTRPWNELLMAYTIFHQMREYQFMSRYFLKPLRHMWE